MILVLQAFAIHKRDYNSNTKINTSIASGISRGVHKCDEPCHCLILHRLPMSKTHIVTLIFLYKYTVCELHEVVLVNSISKQLRKTDGHV